MRILNDEKKSKSKKFGRSNIILSSGIVLVIALVIVLFLIIFRLIKFMVYYKYKWYARYMTIHDMIFYNLFIRYIIQSTLKL